MKQILYLIVLAAFIFIGGQLVSDLGHDGHESNATNRNENDILYQKVETGDMIRPMIFFCPKDNCTRVLLQLIEEHDTVHCALYDLDLPELINIFIQKNISVVIDDHNYEPFENISNFRKDTSSQLSHNKFCIFDDDIVLTGSFNPTFNGAYRNNNNVIVLQSRKIAANYLEEFYELWNGTFGKGDKVVNQRVRVNNITFENAFCPEDSCKEIVLREINRATESIIFMTFSFTDTDIANALIEKADSGVNVTGVMEAKRITMQYNVFEILNGTNVSVLPDVNRYTMHHKVFIIDEKIVITGSYNPTKSGDSKNDENILIIYDEDIAAQFLAEFNSLINSIED
jgi:phosphatidylserine/phosphatidylglycerophosphate/cardiolipin synthase-like enzyme